jgi:hypothetical protein
MHIITYTLMNETVSHVFDNRLRLVGLINLLKICLCGSVRTYILCTHGTQACSTSRDDDEARGKALF